MKARRLLEGSTYPPEVLAVLFQAFDQAWLEIEHDFEGDGPRENGRLTLASICSILQPPPAHADAGDVVTASMIAATMAAFRKDFIVKNPCWPDPLV